MFFTALAENDRFLAEVARVMEYSEAYRRYSDDVEIVGTAGAA